MVTISRRTLFSISRIVFFSNYTEKIKIELSELVEGLNAGESVVVLPKEIMKEALGGQRHVCLCPPEAKRAILGGK